MRRTCSVGVVFALLFFCSGALRGFEGGDTGTYRILNYKVKLTLCSDGEIRIDYYQKWKVTDGHIPWITVGVPNSHYEIVENGLAASVAAKADSGDQSLVRIDLDKDYQPGETFEISFSTMQRWLLYPDGAGYKLDFTPGWYDRAAIDSMEIRVSPLGNSSDVTGDPSPSSQTEDELIWNKSGLAEGERFPISLSVSAEAVGGAVPEENLRGEEPLGGAWSVIGPAVIMTLIFGCLVAAFVVLFKYGSSGKRSKYSGGRIFRGGSGGRGGGGHCACACACAGCACACACAGGGGAGCSRKLEHRCPLCYQNSNPIMIHRDMVSDKQT